MFFYANATARNFERLNKGLTAVNSSARLRASNTIALCAFGSLCNARLRLLAIVVKCCLVITFSVFGFAVVLGLYLVRAWLSEKNSFANGVLKTLRFNSESYTCHQFALMSRKRRLPVAFVMRTRMSLSACACGIGSVSVCQTALAWDAIDCRMYIIFFLV